VASPIPQKQDHESVRTLAIAIGVRPAARQLGLNEDTVCTWAKREHWFEVPEQPPSKAIDVKALKAQPGDILLQEIAENGKETKLSLSRSARRMAKDAENATLRHSPYVHRVAQTAALVNPELYQDKGKEPSQVAVNIAILG
jgi:hypothetical protein